MDKQRAIEIAEELKAKHNKIANEALQMIIAPLADAQSIFNYSIVASRREAKADALEELIERLEEEE